MGNGFDYQSAMSGFSTGFMNGYKLVRDEQDRRIKAQELERQHKREDVADTQQAELYKEKTTDWTNTQLSNLERGALKIHEQYKDDPDGEMKALAPLNEQLKKYNGGHGWETYAGPEMANWIDLGGKAVSGQIDMNDPNLLNAANWRHEQDLNKGLGKVDNNYVTEDGVTIPAKSTIDRKRISRIIPGPNGTIAFELQVDGTRPDGSKFSYNAPLTEGRENGGKDHVRLVDAHRVFDSLTGDAIMRKVATSPGFQNSLKASYYAHGGTEKDLEGGNDFESVQTPTGEQGAVQTRSFNKKTGKYGEPIATGQRWGFGKTGASGKMDKDSNFLEYLATHQFKEDYDAEETHSTAYAKAARFLMELRQGDSKKAVQKMAEAAMKSGEFNSPQEAVDFAQEFVNKSRVANPTVEPSEPAKERKLSPALEGKILRNKETGERGIVRDGKIVPLSQVAPEARPGLQKRATNPDTQRQIDIIQANIDSAKQSMRMAEKDRNVANYQSAQKQLQAYQEKMRQLTLGQ